MLDVIKNVLIPEIQFIETIYKMLQEALVYIKTV